jgi:hypothetical protein
MTKRGMQIMSRVIYTIFLAALLAATAARVLWSAALGVSGAAPERPLVVTPAPVFDADYVQGLAKLGIVKLPDYKPPPGWRGPSSNER